MIVRSLLALLCCTVLLASEAPSISAPSRSSGDPTWTWLSGGGSGLYAIRFSSSATSGYLTSASYTSMLIDSETWNGPVNLGAFTYNASDLSGPTLAHGDTVTLELKELSGVVWSATSSATITMDTLGPHLALVDVPGSLATRQTTTLVLQARDGSSTADPESVSALSEAISITNGTVTSISTDPDDSTRILIDITCGSSDGELILTPTTEFCTDIAGNACLTNALDAITISSSLEPFASTSGVLPFGYAADTARTLDEMELTGALLQTWNTSSGVWQTASSIGPGEAAALIINTAQTPTVLDPPETPGPFTISVTSGWNLISFPFSASIPWDSSTLQVSNGGETTDLATAAENGWCSDSAWLWTATENGYLLLGEQVRGPGTATVVPAWSAVWWHVTSDNLDLIIDASMLQNQ